MLDKSRGVPVDDAADQEVVLGLTIDRLGIQQQLKPLAKDGPVFGDHTQRRAVAELGTRGRNRVDALWLGAGEIQFL